MDEMQKMLIEIQEEIQNKLKTITEKTGKAIEFKADWNKSYIKINNKKIEFKIIGDLRTFVAGMYEGIKDL